MYEPALGTMQELVLLQFQVLGFVGLRGGAAGKRNERSDRSGTCCGDELTSFHDEGMVVNVAWSGLAGDR